MKFLLLLLNSLYLGESTAEIKPIPTSFGVWSEWVQYSKLPNRFPFLIKQNARLHVAVREDEIKNPSTWVDFIKMMAKAKSQGIEIWIWPLLSKEHGYWLNQWNSDQYSQFVEILIQNLEFENIKPTGISMDLEPPPEKMENFLNLISKFKIKKVIEQAKANVDLVKFEKAQNTIKSLSLFLHEREIQTHAVSTPFVLEDSEHKKTVQQIFGIPLDQSNFDYVSFMAYRSEYERIVGKMNSRMIYEYSKRALKKYGNQASIDLGVVGNIEFPHPIQGYQDPKLLFQDIAAAKAAGINRIQVYSLDGMDDRNWLMDVNPHKPGASVKFELLDRFIRIMLSSIY